MEWNSSLVKRAALFFTVVVYVSGLIGMHSAWRPWFISMTPFSLLVSTAVLLQHQQLHTIRTTSWMVGAFLIGYFAEVVGVNTGLLFGDYAYGEALGPKLLATPLMIGVNWLLVTLIVNEVVWRVLPVGTSGYLGAILGAAGCTALDWWIEPGAIQLGYWTWEVGYPPLENYFGWFLVSLVISVAYFRLMTPVLRNSSTLVLLALQLLFFGVIR
jgi:putative membrane protein